MNHAHLLFVAQIEALRELRHVYVMQARSCVAGSYELAWLNAHAEDCLYRINQLYKEAA